MTEISHAIKRVILFQGVKTSFSESTTSTSARSTMTQTTKHRFSRCIEKIVVLQFVPTISKPSIEKLYLRYLAVAVDEAITDGSAQKLFLKYRGIGRS